MRWLHRVADLRMEDLHRWHRRSGGGQWPARRDDRCLPPPAIVDRRDVARDAAFVPPPPDRVGLLMADLIDFVNAEDNDPVTQAAVAHAQFEAIHPYSDGNGRIGRIHIG